MSRLQQDDRGVLLRDLANIGARGSAENESGIRFGGHSIRSLNIAGRLIPMSRLSSAAVGQEKVNCSAQPLRKNSYLPLRASQPVNSAA